MNPAGLELRVARAGGVVSVTIVANAAVILTKSSPQWCPTAAIAIVVAVVHGTTVRAELDDFSETYCSDDFSVDKTY